MNQGSSSGPTTPLRNLNNNNTLNLNKKNISTTASLDYSSYNLLSSNFLTNLQSSSTATVSQFSSHLINNDNIDIILASWKRQIESSPITLPPRNIQTLSSNIFISYDFVYWLMRSVNNFDVLEEALAFADHLVN